MHCYRSLAETLLLEHRALWGHSLVSHHWAEWDLTHWESNVVVESWPLRLKEHLVGPFLYGGSIQMQVNNVEEASQTYKLYQTRGKEYISIPNLLHGKLNLVPVCRG